MLLCTDCHLPAPLDDAVTIFADGTCTCIVCHGRGGARRQRIPAELRRAITAILDAA